VAALVADGVTPFELGVACEVFGIERPELADPWYRFIVCAAEPPPLRTGAGFEIATPFGLRDLDAADTIVIPSWRDVDVCPPNAMLDAVRRAHRRGARLVSVCSGAFVLAYAGLLDGLRATTHWMHSDALTERFPGVKVDPDVLYVDEGQILTSAGTAAGIDLCLHIVRLDGGQAQFVDAPVPTAPATDGLSATLDWAVGHLDQPITVEQLARRALVSPRTFARRFRAAAGTTPLQWLLRQRVLLAQRLLETTDLPVETIADRCGFGSAAALRTHFRRLRGTSPLAYRRTFREAAG
jgi:transcriptional regulator GlxA family with amidase domain